MNAAPNPERVCSKCLKPSTFREGHAQCRECERAYGRGYHRKNAERDAAYREANRDHYRKLNVEIARRKKAERHAALDKIKSVPCKDCGCTFPPHVMDFDHRDPTNKSAEINYLLNKTHAPWTRILEEIGKCDVVCVCCHRLRTWKPPKEPTGLRTTDFYRRRLLIELKNVPCVDCGGLFHYCQMDFDHVRGEKKGCVPRMRSQATLLEEAAKCDVVCANCHRERTQARGNGQRRLNPNDVDMIWKRRQAGGLQTLVVSEPRKLDKPAYRPWHEHAGKMTDKQVAEIGGVTIPNVCLYRQKMGIPSFRSNQSNQMKMESAHA